MNSPLSYREANLVRQEQKNKALRQQIITADDQKSLELILDAPRPAALVQSFPDQDLHYLLHKIGPEDFLPVLSMATSTQWEYMLDVEVWEDDRLNTAMMEKTFGLLFQASPERFLRWIIMEKPAYFEFFLSRYMTIHIREHDEVPPEDFDDYTTIDDTFYFRFPNVADLSIQAEHEDGSLTEDDRDYSVEESERQMQTSDMITAMVTKLAEMDLSVYHGLLMETKALLPAETEEEEFRLKNMRLAEKGFLPFHEAVGIYQSVKIKGLRKRQALKGKEAGQYHPVAVPDFYSQFFKGENPFAKAISLLSAEELARLESEIAALINKVISADRIRIRAREDLEKAVQKTCDCLGLGLEFLEKKSPSAKTPTELVQTYFLEDIFRIGARQSLDLKTKAEGIYHNSFITGKDLPLGFWGERFLGIFGGLLLERPLFFDNYQTQGGLYRNFKTLNEIHQTRDILTQIQAMDEFLCRIQPDFSSFTKGVLTCESVILTLWAKDRLNMASDLACIPVAEFRTFFQAMFSTPETSAEQTNDIRLEDMCLWAAKAANWDSPDILPDALVQVFARLLLDISREYENVSPDHIDPRFIPHFLLQ